MTRGLRRTLLAAALVGSMFAGSPRAGSANGVPTIVNCAT